MEEELKEFREQLSQELERDVNFNDQGWHDIARVVLEQKRAELNQTQEDQLFPNEDERLLLCNKIEIVNGALDLLGKQKPDRFTNLDEKLENFEEQINESISGFHEYMEKNSSPYMPYMGVMQKTFYFLNDHNLSLGDINLELNSEEANKVGIIVRDTFKKLQQALDEYPDPFNNEGPWSRDFREDVKNLISISQDIIDTANEQGDKIKPEEFKSFFENEQQPCVGQIDPVIDKKRNISPLPTSGMC
jgi:hypothetical protein